MKQIRHNIGDIVIVTNMRGVSRQTRRDFQGKVGTITCIRETDNFYLYTIVVGYKHMWMYKTWFKVLYTA